MFRIKNISIQKWLSFSLLAINWFLMTRTPPFNYISYRWYDQFLISLLAYIFCGKKFTLKSIGDCKYIYLSYLMGIVLMLIFNSKNTIIWNPDLFQLVPSTFTFQFMWTVKVIIAMITFSFFVTVLSQPMARKVLFYCIIFTSLMKVSVVNQYLKSDIDLLVGLASGGQDKNSMSIIFNISIMMLIPFLMNKKETRFNKIVCYLLLPIICFGLISSIARSGTMILFFSLVQVMILYFIYFPLNVNKLKTSIMISLVAIFSFFYIINFIQKYDFAMQQWVELFSYLEGNREGAGAARGKIINAGLSYIWDNGFIIGHGFMSGPGINDNALGTPYNFHNSFLEYWVTVGILGLFALIIFSKILYTEILYQIKKFSSGNGSSIDLGYSFMGFTLVPTLLFFDLGFIWFFVSLISGIKRERYFSGNDVIEININQDKLKNV